MSTRSISSQAPQSARGASAAGRIFRAGLVAVVAAVLANILARFLLFAILPLPAEFPPLSVGPIALLTAVGVGLGTLVYGLIYRFSRSPQRVFTIVALVALALSILPNLALMADPSAMLFPFPGASSLAFGVLIIFHVIAGLVTIAVLRKTP